jgi:hypothetical protein
MACPNCGRKGSVPPDRLDSRLRCKKCDSIFHLDTSGRVVLGEPGAQTKAPRLRQAAGNAGGGLADALDSVKNLSREGKALVALGLVVLSGYYLSARLLGGTHGLPPGMTADSLEGRTTVAAEAFIDKDASTLRRMASAGTEDHLIEWYNNVRPLVGDYKHQEAGYDVAVAIMSTGRRDKTEGVTSSAEAALIFPMKPGEATQEAPFTLRLAWKCERDEWKLEGTLMKDTTPKGRK